VFRGAGFCVVGNQGLAWCAIQSHALVAQREVEFRRCGTGATRESRRSSDQHSAGAYTSRFEIAGLP
jgi:hypothetical protein